MCVQAINISRGVLVINISESTEADECTLYIGYLCGWIHPCELFQLT